MAAPARLSDSEVSSGRVDLDEDGRAGVLGAEINGWLVNEAGGQDAVYLGRGPSLRR
jgi:hypothetical protein